MHEIQYEGKMMPYIVMTAKYPSHLAQEVTQKAMEANKKNLFPDDSEIQEVRVQSAGKLTEEGIKLMTVTLVKEGKLEEAIANIVKELGYFSQIAGFESTMEIWATREEGVQWFGIQLPKD